MQDIKAVVREEKPPEPLLLNDVVGWEWAHNIQKYPAAIDYLEKNNCIDAFKTYPVKFFYDKIKNRVVFVSFAQSLAAQFVLATGRSLNGETPKWYKYVALPGEYYMALTTDKNAIGCTRFVVEDCASACSLSRIGCTIALCGTTYDAQALANKLLKSGGLDIIICLDADAQIKAMDLKRDLEAFGKFRSVKTVNLSNDAKYLTVDQLKKELSYA